MFNKSVSKNDDRFVSIEIFNEKVSLNRLHERSFLAFLFAHVSLSRAVLFWIVRKHQIIVNYINWPRSIQQKKTTVAKADDGERLKRTNKKIRKLRSLLCLRRRRLQLSFY